MLFIWLFSYCFSFLSFFSLSTFFPSLLSVVYTLLLPSFALGMRSCAVSSCQTLFCFKPLTPSFSETSYFHICFFLSPSCSSISLFLFILQHFLHPPHAISSQGYLVLHPPPAFSSQGYLGFPSLFTSLSLPCSLPYSTYLSFTFTRRQHFVLPPLLLPCLSPSSLSFILSASPHHACELSRCLCSHQKLLALS